MKHKDGGTQIGAPRRLTLLSTAVLLLLVVVMLVGCGPINFAKSAVDYDATVATAWFDLSLELVRETPGFSPPVASRVFGYLGVTLYEAVRPGMFGFRSLAGQLNDLHNIPKSEWLVSYHWPSAANAALASITRALFPTTTPDNLAAIDALEEQFAQQFIAQTDVVTFRRSVAWGQSVARTVYNWSKRDGGHEGYSRNFPESYVPPVGPGLWVATPPNYAQALQPTWGDNRPFVLADGAACPAPPPPAYAEDPTSAFYAEALEVYTTVRARDPEQIATAVYWADDPVRTATPPGHWIAILTGILKTEEASLAMAAESYAKLGMAVADAFVTCWHTKYQYNVLRPITYIQAVIDPTWNTPELTDPVQTPPFPEYTSGHSVQSGAAAVVLTHLFGEGYAFTDTTHAAAGLAPRSYASFAEAAQEAALSRLYGGIHFRSAIEVGMAQGECVGARVLSLRFGRY